MVCRGGKQHKMTSRGEIRAQREEGDSITTPFKKFPKATTFMTLSPPLPRPPADHSLPEDSKGGFARCQWRQVAKIMEIRAFRAHGRGATHPLQLTGTRLRERTPLPDYRTHTLVFSGFSPIAIAENVNKQQLKRWMYLQVPIKVEESVLWLGD